MSYNFQELLAGKKKKLSLKEGGFTFVGFQSYCMKKK